MPLTAQTAVDILESIKAAYGPAALAYWVTPNTILTLSGARAFCDGVYWGDDQQLNAWKKDIAKILHVIQDVTPLLYSSATIETARENEMYASFELISKEGLCYALRHTKLLGSTNTEPLTQSQGMDALLAKLIELLRKHHELRSFNNEDLNHAAFGLLLGYPDEAIVGLLQAEQHENDPFAEPTIEADIRGAMYYICPKPVYSYPRYLVNDTAIRQHEQLWSRILEDYYHSGFHKMLEKEESFQKKMAELGNFR